MIQVYIAEKRHEVAFRDIVALLDKHKETVSPSELLAIASNIVGKILALQDKTAHSISEYTDIIATNIEIGNKTVIDDFVCAPVKGNC